MESALASYARQVEPEETSHYAALKAELSQYWQTLDPILNWDAPDRRARGYIFLRDEVFPRRTAMLEIAGRIADINEQQLNAGNERVVALLLKFQNRLAVILLATLALGLGMAAFSTRKILRLEAHAQTRYLEVADARRQLTNLSDKLGQALSAVLVELRNLSTGFSMRSEEPSRNQVELIKGLVENTVRVVRNMALLLRPSMLDDLGLIPALRWQAREVSKRQGRSQRVPCERLR